VASVGAKDMGWLVVSSVTESAVERGREEWAAPALAAHPTPVSARIVKRPKRLASTRAEVPQ
jgi:hypothetical protein